MLYIYRLLIFFLGKVKGRTVKTYALVISFPEGGGGWTICRGIGDFVGNLQQIRATMVGEMWGHRFMMPQLSGKIL